MRESLEFNLFASKFIVPYISVMEQDIRNEFSKNNYQQNKTTYRYSLDYYSIQDSVFDAQKSKKFVQSVKKLRKTGISSVGFTNIDHNELDNILEEDLSSELGKSLRAALVKKLSKPVFLDGKYHLFYVKKKTPIESVQFKKKKNIIKATLFEKSFSQTLDRWAKKEKKKHHIKVLL